MAPMTFESVFSDLQRATKDLVGAQLVWKDAEPGFWSRWGREIGQHLDPRCIEIKTEAEKMEVCCRFENDLELLKAPLASKTCPFGLSEWRWPIYGEGRLLGNLLIGLWEGKDEKLSEAKPLMKLLEAWIPLLVKARLGEEEDRVDDAIIVKAIAYMDENLRADLRLEAVAKAVSRSSSRLRHLFVEKTGKTYSDWLRSRLMKESARRLILNPKSRSLDVALELGWKDERYFNTVFRRYHGDPPGRWRRQVMSLEG